MKIATVITIIGLLGTATLANAQNNVISSSHRGVPTTNAVRFSISADGVITDVKTGLEWVVGPDKGLSYDEAESWVKGCKKAGGGWRMPKGDELGELRLEGDTRNGYELDPAFKDKVSPSKKVEGMGIAMIIVWNTRDPGKADYTNFPFSHVLLAGREYKGADGRVFAVRSARK